MVLRSWCAVLGSGCAFAVAAVGCGGGDASCPDRGCVAPDLVTFTATPDLVPRGATATVAWNWTYAAAPVPTPTCTVGDLGEVTPGAGTPITLAADTTFTLSCQNTAGSDTAEVVVRVGDSAIPPDRVPPPGTWESAGVEGGIPDRTTICATVTDPPYGADPTGATTAVAAIQAAIDACPDGQVVMVPAGTYLIDEPLDVRSPITVRGIPGQTVFRAGSTATLVRLGFLGPWPPPKANPGLNTPITGGADRASTAVTVADASAVAVGDMIMIDELDDPDLVWTKDDNPGRYRASMHRVEAVAGATITFRPPLPIAFTRSPQLSWFGPPTHDLGIEHIRMLGTGDGPNAFIEVTGAWNAWVYDVELTAMPAKSVIVDWSGHVELRRIYMHDQANGGPNSEGLDLLTDVSWSLVIDNICVAGGFPQINIGDGGANPYYSGGFGNVIAYNYAVDAYYTDPPDAPDAGKQPFDIGTNHSPHTMYNLVEGNVAGKFGVDAYHGSGSHTVLLRNRVLGTSRWPGVDHQTAIQIDRRNLYYTLLGNVLGSVAAPADQVYATASGWAGTAIYRLGFPDGGNDGYDGTSPPTPLAHADGGPRDLYVERTTTAPGTTLIEGNWDATTGAVDWSGDELAVPASLFLTTKPDFFGSLPWPPVDPGATATDDPTIIPAGYRYVHGADP